MELKTMLAELCEADGMGGLDGALLVAEKYLSEICDVNRHANSLIGVMGEGDKTVMLEAHIDEIGMMVTSIENGFLTVAPAGGIDSRMLSGMRVSVHGKQKVTGVFCSIPPHLRGKESATPKFDDLYIDTGLGDKAAEIISIGDRVTFKQSFKELSGSLVTCKSLDNRAGVAAVLLAAEKLSKTSLNKEVVICLSDMEELGGMGAKTAGFDINPDEALAVDVSFGNAPDISEDKTGRLGDGAMIGISPVLSHSVADRLKSAAKCANESFQIEVMGGKTSTDADVLALNRGGVECGLLSIPLRNMHTPVEIVDMKDIESVANIISQFVLTD